MNQWFNVLFVILVLILLTNGLAVKRNSVQIDEKRDSNVTVTKSNSTLLRKKRVFDFSGGLAMGFGAYDYYNYYGDLVSDYSYDYYDWICSETSCQLCDVLTSECCDPDVDVNCFLPDSCFNNPCLSGGTCITSRTVDDRPDFTCVCLPGLTGKYCQLVNDYFLGAERLAVALMNPPAVLGGLGGVGLNIPAGQGAPPLPPAIAVLSEMQRRLSPPPPPPPPPSPSPGQQSGSASSGQQYGYSDNQQDNGQNVQKSYQQPQGQPDNSQQPYNNQMNAQPNSYSSSNQNFAQQPNGQLGYASNQINGQQSFNPSNGQMYAQQPTYQANNLISAQSPSRQPSYKAYNLMHAQPPSQQVNSQLGPIPGGGSKNGFQKPLAGHRKLALNQKVLNPQAASLSQVVNQQSIGTTTATPNYVTSTATLKKAYKPSPGLKVLGSKRRSCPDGQIFNSEKNECVEFSLRKKEDKGEKDDTTNKSSEILN